MAIKIRPVRPGDIFGMTRVILAARGFSGAELDGQIERDLARFQEMGIVEMIESEALIAAEDGRMVGVLRYGEFEEDVHLMRPDIDPAADEEAVIRAFASSFWNAMGEQARRAIFLDYPQAGAKRRTLGALFERCGFEKLVDRLDMQVRLTQEIAPETDELTYHGYSAKLHDRFLQAFARSFEGSLDPMMDWDARHPEESFAIFRERFGENNPDLWVLATDREGRDAGFALFQHFAGGRYAGQVVLLYMAVLPEARGRGYGEEILREGLRRIYKWRNSGALVGLTVSAPNRPASKIYHRLGFQPAEAFSVYTLSRNGVTRNA